MQEGKVTALLGRNGSGKSTLLNAITKHPDLTYDIDIDEVPKPMFLGFQKPVEIPELTTIQLLMYLDHEFGYKSNTGEEFITNYYDILQYLDITEDMLTGPLNKNVSGGENKRLELLQMYIIKPKLVLLDEIDTGLDLDMLIKMGNFIKDYIQSNNPTVVIITHNLSFLKYFKIHRVIVLDKGEVLADKSATLIKELESKGFVGTFPQLT